MTQDVVLGEPEPHPNADKRSTKRSACRNFGAEASPIERRIGKPGNDTQSDSNPGPKMAPCLPSKPLFLKSTTQTRWTGRIPWYGSGSQLNSAPPPLPRSWAGPQSSPADQH